MARKNTKKTKKSTKKTIKKSRKPSKNTSSSKHSPSKPKVTVVKTHKQLSKKVELRSEKDIAMDFATKVHEKFNHLIKASVLFGSQAKDTATVGSDIDIIFIVDDASIQWDLELISWYREELSKLISEQSYGRDLHINSMKLTTWWLDLMHGDPVVINILRYGEALIDIGGFFNPIKSLLLQGKIRSTPEAVYTALQRAPGHLARSRLAELNAIEGLYWAMVDSAQAALITAGKIPPSPEHLPSMLKETFADKNLIKLDLVRDMHQMYSLHKAIVRKELTDLKGKEIDTWQEKADSFVKVMVNLVDEILEKKQ